MAATKTAYQNVRNEKSPAGVRSSQWFPEVGRVLGLLYADYRRENSRQLGLVSIVAPSREVDKTYYSINWMCVRRHGHGSLIPLALVTTPSA